MTEDQLHMIAALQCVTFQVGSPHKRFARDMGQKPMAFELTDRQDAYLRQIVHRYRRQISPRVVGLAGAS